MSASVEDVSSGHGMDDSFPSELQERLTAFDETISEIDEILKPFHHVPLTQLQMQLSSLDKAKLDLLGAYSINSLFWMYLNTKGENPKEHGIKEELDRVRSYMRRLKEIQDKEKAPRLNKDTTQRFVRSALWQLAHNKPIPEHLVQPPETAGTSQDESGSAPAVAAEGGEREGHVKRARKSQGDVKKHKKRKR